MILGALGMLVANAAALLGAQAILERLRSGKPAVDFVLLLLLRLFLISAAVLVAGLARLLNPLALGLAGAALIGVLVPLGVHRRLPRWSGGGWAPGWTLLAAAVAVRLLLQVWFLAPYHADALGYHRPKVAERVRAGGFGLEFGPDLRSTFPAGFELIETWWVVFLHHDVLIEAAGLEFLLLSAASTYAIARELGWSSRTATAAAALFVMNPALHFMATSCINDGAITGLLVATVALIVAGVHPLLVLLPVAMGAGVKPTFLYTLPGLALMAALLPRSEGVDPASRRTVLTVAAGALLVGAFWYLRNAVVYHNPIYPMGPGGMRSLVSGAILQRVGPSWASLRDNLGCFLDIRVYDAQTAPDALCTNNFNWGPVGFALGAVAAIPALREDRLLRRVASGLAVSALGVFLSVELDPWCTRFVVFLAVLPALALARFWDRYRFVPLLGGAALLVQFVSTCIPGNLPPETLKALVRQGWRERSSMPAPAESRSSRVAYSCDDFGESYPLYGPGYDRGVVYVRDRTAQDLLDHLDRDRIEAVYVSPNLHLRTAIFEEGVARGRLKPLRQGAWKGYEVLPPR
ncbi:MAG TPA: hypothetical protein VM222_07515 [Planctomycetota bacterium]|nr:hypothetical protein [Planctomycetota bacterium]